MKGQESQRLRTYFTANSMVPSRDLDDLGRVLFSGDVKKVEAEFNSRVEAASSSQTDARQATIDEIYTRRWGPTEVGVMNLLLLASLIYPHQRSDYVDIMKWLIAAGVPVDGVDLSGTTALMHSISTKPAVDTEIAQILWDAGAEINHRDRYGGTTAHEMCKVWSPDPTAVGQAEKALKWFVAHGGNLDIVDGDGITARYMITRTPWTKPMLATAVAEDKRRMNAGGCNFCGSVYLGSDPTKPSVAKCGRCKKALYCKPPRTCQKVDWPHHKKQCKA